MTYPPAIEKALAYLQEKNIISFHRESVLRYRRQYWQALQ